MYIANTSTVDRPPPRVFVVPGVIFSSFCRLVRVSCENTYYRDIKNYDDVRFRRTLSVTWTHNGIIDKTFFFFVRFSYNIRVYIYMYIYYKIIIILDISGKTGRAHLFNGRLYWHAIIYIEIVTSHTAPDKRLCGMSFAVIPPPGGHYAIILLSPLFFSLASYLIFFPVSSYCERSKDFRGLSQYRPGKRLPIHARRRGGHISFSYCAVACDFIFYS